jgi:hypothetical protein
MATFLKFSHFFFSKRVLFFQKINMRHTITISNFARKKYENSPEKKNPSWNLTYYRNLANWGGHSWLKIPLYSSKSNQLHQKIVKNCTKKSKSLKNGCLCTQFVQPVGIK